MRSSSRENVVSSFTLIKGAMIDETYAILESWDLAQTKRQNLDRLREYNPVGAGSATWLRDIAKVLNRRFDPDGRDRALVVLAKGGCGLEEWKPIVLWHITRDEFLLRDFLQNWLFRSYESGLFQIRPDALYEYLRGIEKQGGTTEHAWSETTLRRVAAGLLKMGVDFGLLRGSAAKEFATYHLPDRSFLYLLHAIRGEAKNPSSVINAPDWRMFWMRPADVEQELLRLHQFRMLDYQVAGSLVQLSLPCANAAEYAERMVS